jgi:hypothetical protein
VGLAGERLGARGSQTTACGVLAVQTHGRRMHDHRRELRVLVDLQAEQQHRRLCRDQHLEVFGQLEPVRRLPSRRVEECGDERLHAIEFVGIQHPPVFEVAHQHLVPVRIECRRVAGEQTTKATEHR